MPPDQTRRARRRSRSDDPLPRGELDRDATPPRPAAGDVRLLASDRFEGRGLRPGLIWRPNIASEFAAAGLQVDVIGGEP